jgi:MFS family permease
VVKRSTAVPLLLAVQLATGLVLSPVFTFLPVFLKDLGLSVTLVSLVIALQRMVGLGSSMAGGVLLDSVGAKRTLVAGQVLYFAATLVFAARAPWPVALLWAASGIGMGPVTLATTGYLIEKADPARLGLFTALLSLGITIGAVIASPLAGLLVDRSGWQALVPFTALPALALLLFTAIALPRSARHAGLRLPGTAPGRPLFPGTRSARLIALGRLLPTVSYGMLLVYVPLLLKSAGASNADIGFYATAINVGASLASLAVGRIADRSGWTGPTLAGYAALALGSLGVAVFHARAWPVAVCGTVAVAAAWALSAVMPIQVTKHVPVAEHGRALAFINQSWFAAMILSGLAGGVLFDVWPGLPFLVGFLAAAAGAPVMMVVARGGDPGSVNEPGRPPGGSPGAA